MIVALLFSSCNNQENAMIDDSISESVALPAEVTNYYESSSDISNTQPYSYFMNKYLDYGLAYFEKWDLDVQAYSIEQKQELLNKLVHEHFPEPDLQTDEHFDSYCSHIYQQLLTELNSHTIIIEQKKIAETIADGGIETWDDEDFSICIGGITYSKLEILRRIESGIPFEYEDEEIDSQDSVEQSDNIMEVGRYNLLALWGKKIRYRNARCPDIALMRTAMTEWANADNNVIRFVEIPNTGWNRFAWCIGCSYHICLNTTTDNNVNGSSTTCCVPWATISMHPHAPFGSYLHELGHTLGLVHEHSRPDRDYSVIIHKANIRKGYTHNFKKYLKSSVTVYGDFDFNSIMMYSAYGFSINGKPTITKKDSTAYVVNTDSLSQRDKLYIKNLYY